MERKRIIKEYLLENTGLPNLENDLDIFETGLVNSLFSIQLMTYLEKEFKIKITMEDLNMDNFGTINSIDNFILNKLKCINS
jgi:methoxymalonate biosynthesis acyl carrier protein